MRKPARDASARSAVILFAHRAPKRGSPMAPVPGGLTGVQVMIALDDAAVWRLRGVTLRESELGGPKWHAASRWRRMNGGPY